MKPIRFEGKDAFNRTSMESKLRHYVCKCPCRLLIEPVWNRNSRHDYIVTLAYLATFNRTSMESKPEQARRDAMEDMDAFNRTSMESKLEKTMTARNWKLKPFNRTSMESKLHYER